MTLPFVVRSVQPVLLKMDGEAEEAAASLGAGELTVFRRIILPTILPAILSGSALGFSRAMGEFGAIVLLSGNIPFSTELTSVYIFGLAQSGDMTSASALAVVLLSLSLVMLLALQAAQRWALRHAQ